MDSASQIKEVHHENVKAYRVAFKAAVQDARAWINEPSNYKVRQVIKDKFEALDTDRSGAVSKAELQHAFQGQGIIASGATFDLLFEVVDADGNGALDLEESLLLWTCLQRARACDGCQEPIDVLVDEGYTCMLCYDADAIEEPSNPTCFDLCTPCMSQGRLGCRKHGDTAMVHSRKADTAAAALPLQLGLGFDNGITCWCCGETHNVVLSYLQPGLRDLHMRPMKGAGGDMQFVCEFCAVRICKQHERGNMCWKPELATPGLCAQPGTTCTLMCRGAGSFGGWEKVEADAAARVAAHCPTCIAKLDQGVPLHRPSYMPLQMGVKHPQQSSTAGLSYQQSSLPVDQNPTATCYCCQQTHTVSVGGQAVDAYLTGQHMLQDNSGRWLCEWCTVWTCSRCGKCCQTLAAPKVGQWSMDLVCAQKCRKHKKGGWHIDQEQLYNKGDDLGRTHCMACRMHLISRTLLDRQAAANNSSTGTGTAEAVSNVTEHIGAGMKVTQAVGTVLDAAGCSVM